MKKILLVVVLLTFGQTGYGCDESCKRTQAETANNIKFAPYLEAKYCKTTAVDFLINTRRSLQTYKDKQLPTAHRGGARNIRNFISQRKDWLLECDKYMELTGQGRIFRDKETTEKIVASMTALLDELQKIIIRPKNKLESRDLVTNAAASKFDEMFKLTDSHYLDLQKRGLL